MMETKYYLEIEIRYSIPEDDENEFQRTHFTKKIHSDLFATEKECIEYGNQVISKNLWLEQYPGHVGQQLNRRFGRPLVAYYLKNGSQIFISVNPLLVMDTKEINVELSKFNIQKISTKIE